MCEQRKAATRQSERMGKVYWDSSRKHVDADQEGEGEGSKYGKAGHALGGSAMCPFQTASRRSSIMSIQASDNARDLRKRVVQQGRAPGDITNTYQRIALNLLSRVTLPSSRSMRHHFAEQTLKVTNMGKNTAS